MLPWLIAGGGALMFSCLCCSGFGGMLPLALRPFGIDPFGLEAQEEAIQQVKRNAKVRGLLGEPLESGNQSSMSTGWPLSDSMSVHFDIHGPNGAADVDLELRRVDGDWVVSRLEVQPRDGIREPIVVFDVLTKDAGATP